MVLQTERLMLREMRDSDYDALCLMLRDADVMYAYAHAFDEAESRQWLARQQQRYAENGFGLWAVELKSTGEMIGQCGLTLQPLEDRQVIEVGYIFRKEFWHMGYATEAARACRDLAFDRFDAREVYSIIRDNNLPSQAVARRLGMEPRCTFSKHYYGIDMPHIAFSVRRAQSVIVTPRLLLRKFEPGDAEALYEHLSDPEVVRYEPYEPFSRAMAEFEAHARALNPDHRAVALRPDDIAQLAPGEYELTVPTPGRLIGNLYAPLRFSGVYELGFAFNRAYWGRGFAYEATHALMASLFGRNAQRIFARCDAENLRSQQLLTRLGMHMESRAQAVMLRGRRRTILTYSISRDEWPNICPFESSTILKPM